MSEYPDLLLIDGGRTHVMAVKEVLADMGLEIPVFGMVKDDFHKTRALCTESEEISIAREQAVYGLIYRVQEEVHRYTVSRMSAAKSKTVKHSSLERINGIGAAKARLLLAKFGSLNAIKSATEEELSLTKSISKADAKNIYNYFHGD